MNKEFQCDGHCPVKAMRGCCRNCSNSFAWFRNETNGRLWNTENGFWKEGGCALDRQAMPTQCREYDCRNHDWIVTKRWMNGSWQDIDVKEIPMGFQIAGTVRFGKEEGNGNSS